MGLCTNHQTRHFIMGAVITNTLCRIMMAVVHIVHYTSGCHKALGIYICVCACLCMCVRVLAFCFCHFTTSCFSKLTSESLGRKIYHHLPTVTNNIFWIMIASIGFCICKCEVMNFLCEAMKANRDIMSLCLNRPTGLVIDCRWMTNCICKKRNKFFFIVRSCLVTAPYAMNRYFYRI